MSFSVSLRLDDELFKEMKEGAQSLHLSKTDYIRKAIEHMNAEIKKLEGSDRLKKASLRVRKESMKVNAEFSEIEHDPEA